MRGRVQYFEKFEFRDEHAQYFSVPADVSILAEQGHEGALSKFYQKLLALHGGVSGLE